MAYSTITSGQIQAGEPVTEALLTKIKDNEDNHETRIGILELTVNANEFDAVVADPAIVGFSTHTAIQDAIDDVTAGANILVLRGTFTEDVTINKQLTLTGLGFQSVLDGNLSFSSAASECIVEKIKVNGDLTIASGSIGNSITDLYVTTSMTYTDNNEGIQNFFQGTEI